MKKKLGHSIHFHTDNRGIFGEVVVCVSLCGDCNISMQKVKDKSSVVVVPLPRRSLLILTKAARYEWKHGIPNDNLLSPKRISLTFRAVKREKLKQTIHKWIKTEL